MKPKSIKPYIRILGLLLVLQVVFHLIKYFVDGFNGGLSGLLSILDADFVRLTVGILALYIAREE